MHLLKTGQGEVSLIRAALVLVCLFPVTIAGWAQTATGKAYAVEVAALRSEDCAKELANGLRARGFEAYWIKADQAGQGTYYRVRVGRFEDLDVARDYAEELLDSGLLETCAVTLYEPPVDSLVRASIADRRDSISEPSNTPIAASCPVKLPEPEEADGLVSSINRSKWLLSAGRSVIYTQPAQQGAQAPARDVVLLMRSIDKNRWRLQNNLDRLLSPPASPTPVDPPLSSAKLVEAERRPAAEIKDINNKISEIEPARPVAPLKAPRLQGLIEVRDGQLFMKLRNLDAQRSFNGIARVTLSDDKSHDDVAPLTLTLQPNEEKVVPVDQTTMTSGDWMLMVYDEKQTVQLIRSAPFGQKPAVASAANEAAPPSSTPNDPSPWKVSDSSEENITANILPNVTGIFDATTKAGGSSNSEPKEADKPEIIPGQIKVLSRQIATTVDNVTLEFEISAPQPLGYITMIVRAGKYQDERYALVSSNTGRVPFLIPATEANGQFSFEIKDENGRVLASGVNDFRSLGQ